MLLNFLENEFFAGEALVFGEVSFLSSVWTPDMLFSKIKNIYILLEQTFLIDQSQILSYSFTTFY